MTSLKELLDELEIKTDDLGENNQGNQNEEEFNLKDIKLDDIPEKQRPIFKKLIDDSENYQNEIAKRDLAIRTLQSVTANIPDKTQNHNQNQNQEEKVLGVLEKDDPYAPAFQKIADSINSISKSNERNKEEDFKNNLISFAKENKDIVRYVQDMDKLVEEHPSLKRDIPKLYLLAKTVGERREGKVKQKKDEMKREGNADTFSTEISGMSNQNVSDIPSSKSIADAFEVAQKQLASKS